MADIGDPDRKEISAAHAVVILLFGLTVIAVILGIATGSINQHFLDEAPPATSITIP
jgi:hypothetical protein